jgi:hypothetical protein
MNDGKKVPSGILLFLCLIILMDIIFVIYRGNSLLFEYDSYSSFLSFSPDALLIWGDVLFAVISLIIIPYGFVKRKKSAWIFAIVFLSYSLLRTLLSIVRTGEKTIGYLVFALLVLGLLYLFTTSVKQYFSNFTMAIVPVENPKEYRYGLYTLYTELVQLRNGKNQVIYFFSKHKPKSGNPTTLPTGFHVEVSERSGLPYLKKDPDAFPIAS